MPSPETEGYSAFVVQAAAGLLLSQAGIYNPPGSGVVVVTEQLACVTTTPTSNTVAGFYHFTNVAPFTQSALPVRPNDFRAGVPVSPVVAVTVLNAAVQSDGLLALRRAFLGTNLPRDFAQVIILPPGHGLVCVPDLLNTEIRAGYVWREYPEASL
jgi:hypothetical protein